MEAEVIVPGGAELLAADATLAAVLAEQRDGDAAQRSQVLCGGAVLEPAVVFSEDDVEHPMQAVLDAPVQPGSAAQFKGAAFAAADVVGHLATLHAIDPPEACHPDDGPQVGPVVPAADPTEVVQHAAGPLL